MPAHARLQLLLVVMLIFVITLEECDKRKKERIEADNLVN